MLHTLLENRLREAIRRVLPEADLANIFVRPCPDPRFGDYQSSAIMALAKARKGNPRQLATEVLAQLEAREWCERVEIAGAGFLNFRLHPDAIARVLTEAARGEHLFFVRARTPRTVVVDFSSPNVAKPMHIGHLRSTGIGDCLQRVLRLLGHRVISDNHLGDWGTQFGMLLHGWKTVLDPAALAADPLVELERIYRGISPQCDEKKSQFNPVVRDAARSELVKLQAGDAGNLAIWREMLRLSQTQFDAIYSRLGIHFDRALGESFYNPALPGVVEDLLHRQIARESEGAVAVFSDGARPPKEDPFLVQRDGEWQPDPALIRKSDGAFNYMTTDLATVDYRLKTWSPEEILYVVDDRQAPHFRKLFLTFGRWQPEAAARVKLRHIGFGKILGDDGTPLKTRAGDTPKLAAVLDEAEAEAYRVVTEKNPALPEAERRVIARTVGIGAVKYFDLLPNRESDYQLSFEPSSTNFIWKKMLALNGNTAPYLQYAHARIRSILRKAEAESPGASAAEISLDAPEELALGKQLVNFGLVLAAVAEECRPNYLCNYLYELAGLYARFYENCPVLKAEGHQRASRLALCDLTGRVLKQGLNVLGIEAPERM